MMSSTTEHLRGIAEALVTGSGPVQRKEAGEVILTLLDDRARDQARIAELEVESAELTKALTGLTCGGSEFFTRKGDRYVADIPACVEYVQRVRRDAHERWLRAVHDLREARALLKETPND